MSLSFSLIEPGAIGAGLGIQPYTPTTVATPATLGAGAQIPDTGGLSSLMSSAEQLSGGTEGRTSATGGFPSATSLLPSSASPLGDWADSVAGNSPATIPTATLSSMDGPANATSVSSVSAMQSVDAGTGQNVSQAASSASSGPRVADDLSSVTG